MRNLQMALAASTLLLSASTGYLWLRLRSERERADLESSERARQELAVAELERRQAELERELGRQRREAAAASVEPRPGAAPPARQAVPAPVSLLGAPSAAGIPAGLRRMSVVQTYGELARELRLSPADTNTLIDLLVAEDEGSLGSARELPADPSVLRAQLDLLDRKKEAAIADVFGPEQAAHYRRYRDSLSQHMELRMIREHLDVLGTPISEPQREKLLAILIDEQRPLAPGTRSERGPLDFEQLQTARGEMQRRISERAAAVLEPEQRERLDEFYAMQNPRMPAAGGTTAR